MLVTLQEVKDYLGETTTDYDDFLNGQIALYSAAVSNYCNRILEQGTYTQTFYASDYEDEINKNIELYHFPVTAIASVTEIEPIDGSDTETILTPSVDYRFGLTGRVFKLCDGYPTRWFSNLRKNGRVEVVYTAGYADIPVELQHVIFRLIENDYSKKVSGIAQGFGSDVQRISIAGVMSLDFDYSLQANERGAKFGMLLGNYINVVDYYRSMRILTGNLRETYVD